MIVKLLTEHHLEFLSSKGGCRGSIESTHVKMPHCWKSRAQTHFVYETGPMGLTSSYPSHKHVDCQSSPIHG